MGNKYDTALNRKDNLTNTCACCNKEQVDFFDICTICGWQNDPVQNDKPDYKGGANKMSLNEAKEAYKNNLEII